MAKEYRKSIRVNGKCVQSPRFERKAAADEWYQQMRESKNFSKHGLKSPHTDVPTFGEWAIWWFHERMACYPQSTWASDEQRLRDYLLPQLKDISLGQITSAMVKELIMKSQITKVDPKNQDLRIAVRPTSFALKVRIKALASIVFQDAMDRVEGPLIKENPVNNVSLYSGRRTKMKTDVVCLTQDAHCDQYLRIAKELALERNAPEIYVMSAIFLMNGPRKSEATALQWSGVDCDNDEITFSHIIEQISMTRVRRTKGGQSVSRTIPMSSQLKAILSSHRAVAAFNGPSDFVLSRPDGRFLCPRFVSSVNSIIRQRLGRHVTTHGLRHSHARKFIADGGPIKALQQNLGHSSLAMTEIYTKLSDNQLHKFKDTVSYNLESEAK